MRVIFKNKSINFGYIFPDKKCKVTLLIGKEKKYKLELIPDVIGMTFQKAFLTLKKKSFKKIYYYYEEKTKTLSCNNSVNKIFPELRNNRIYHQEPESGNIQKVEIPIEIWVEYKKDND